MLYTGNIRSSTITHEDGWKYKIDSYSDVLTIKYIEEDEIKGEISIPEFIAEKVLQDALDLVRKRREVSDDNEDE